MRVFLCQLEANLIRVPGQELTELIPFIVEFREILIRPEFHRRGKRNLIFSDRVNSDSKFTFNPPETFEIIHRIVRFLRYTPSAHVKGFSLRICL